MFSRRKEKSAGKRNFESGKNYYNKQEYSKAEQVFQQLIPQQEKALSAKHKDTLHSKY